MKSYPRNYSRIYGYGHPRYVEAPQTTTETETETTGKEVKYFWPYRQWQNGSTRETVYADTDFAQQIGSLDSYQSCYCMGRYGGAYAVLYQVDGFADRWKIGYVAYHGGVKD